MHLFTKCGGRITVSEHTQEHLRAHPEVWALLADACTRLTLPRDGSPIFEAVYLGRVIGRSGCVEVAPAYLDRPCEFAMRIHRRGPSRVVAGQVGAETRTLVIKADPTDSPRAYALHTAYRGEKAEHEPWSSAITTLEQLQASLEFWGCHALIHDHQVMGKIFTDTWRNVIRQSPNTKLLAGLTM